MKASTTSAPYTPLPSSYPDHHHHHHHPLNVIVLTYYRDPPPSYLFLRRCLLFTIALLLLAGAAFLLYPSDPDLKLARLRLNHVRVNSSPLLTLDLSFSLTIKVRNRDFFSFAYDSLVVSVGYRGRELGLVRSQGGQLRARATSYVNATLDLNGLEVIHDAFYLIEDLASGVIPFDTVTDVTGSLGLVFLQIPIEGRVSCELYVNINNQTVVRQDCYPKVRNTFRFDNALNTCIM
ncbi:hypothetical protein Tsubulata_006029 [Turnera subulata]|uniref:Late embryogenesis abundant protein LEA-2 subgroup domain-containing protein n=1 Tax=Turnera subulata TaxID=218843 RepID=A0A9Q0JLW7_9ROSI|nr:hypothetical protein Tsubulata_006029 [Turnera subulata]